MKDNCRVFYGVCVIQVESARANKKGHATKTKDVQESI